MVRENNYSRVFDHYYTGSVYYKKGDDLRYNPDDRQIYDRGTPIAYMVTDNYDDYKAGRTQNAADAFAKFRESHS